MPLNAVKPTVLQETMGGNGIIDRQLTLMNAQQMQLNIVVWENNT